MRKFKISKLKLNQIFLNEKDIYHLKKVLRIKNFTKIVCYDEKKEYLAQVITYPNFQIEILKDTNIIVHRPYNINVFVGVIKKNNFENLVQSLNELNIKTVTPVYFERSQRSIKLNFTRLNLIVDSSCKQCERQIPLKINEAINFKDLSKINLKNTNIVASFQEFNIDKANIFSQKEYNLFIGPEGGFSLEENKWFMKNFIGIKINDLILKTETAAVSIASILIGKIFKNI